MGHGETRLAWRTSKWKFDLIEQNFPTIQEWVLYNFDTMDISDLEEFGAVLWSTWRNRNSLIFKTQHIEPDTMRVAGAAKIQQGRNPEDAELLALIWSLTYCAKKSWTGFEVEMDSLSIVYKLNRNELTGIKGNLIGDVIQKGSADYARGSYGMA
ncbi:Ribonuclease H-like superfamily protein [Canna indica]|uniref:Ribonuclease H-like superfamily protein n=1 Tax=Canna indica TaxID=4628 RepID=A0AAQ3QLK5_9LILI|nr:Ribonuclease H-like superfamily protein [Canna indica]